jgi:hypothetical protein
VSRSLVAWIAGAGALAGCGQPAGLAGDAATADDAPVVDAALDAAVRDASLVDAPPGLADLQLIAAEMASSLVVTVDVFAPDDCAVIEGCVGAAGRRSLLRFDTVTVNRGTADLIAGVPPAPGQSAGVFQWSACHQHHHVADYASYELIGDAGSVVIGRKQSFCLEDDQQVSPGAPPARYTCRNQGISRGWADVYGRFLPCQWLDVTDLPPGGYTLRVVVNPLNTVVESDTTNNVFTVRAQL